MSLPVDKPIVAFIKRHHVLTLATEHAGVIHNTPLFFAYDAGQNVFVATSSEQTLHVAHLNENPNIAGAIYLETKVVGKIQGVQFCGKMTRPTGDKLAWARKFYINTFPYVVLIDLDLWIIEPSRIKLTDNRLGMAKKLIWDASKGE